MNSLRFLLAIALTIGVIVITNLLFPPAPRPTPQTAADSAAVQPVPRRDTAPTAPPVVAPAPLPPPSGAPATAAIADTIYVRSPLYRYGFSTRGASIVSAELLPYESFTREGSVELAPQGAAPFIGYRIRVGQQEIDLGQLTFRSQPPPSFELSPGQQRSLSFVHDGEAGGPVVEIEYRLQPEFYRVDLRGRVRGLGSGPALLLVDMGPSLRVNEANEKEDQHALSYVVNSRREGIEGVRLDDVEGERIEEGPLLWTALKNKYFVVGVIPGGPDTTQYLGGLVARDLPQEHAAALTTTLPIASDGSFALQLYLGPQESEQLSAVGRDFQDVNPYGWRILRPIIRPLAHFITWAVKGLHQVLRLEYGWVLLLFGVLVRIVLWPLNASAMRSQMKNMELQPKLKEIQDRYKNEPEKLQKEMMRLYKEEGFNPLGGCLPLLIPFPVLITLFFVFQGTIEFRGVDFLWLPDLSRADPLYILPILLGGSMFFLQWLSLRSTPNPNPQMKVMLWFMPIFMTVIFLNLASGLNLYYTASNLASIPQQFQILRERQRRQQLAPPARPPTSGRR